MRGERLLDQNNRLTALFFRAMATPLPPLHAAARDGDMTRMMSVLASSAAEHVNSRDSLRRTPLHLAAFKGQTAAAEMLLSFGANPNVPAQDGVMPLHFAVQAGHVETTRSLLERGANPNAIGTKKHLTPLMAAALRGDGALIHLLLRHGAKREVLDRNGKTAADLAASDDIRGLLVSRKRSRDDEPAEDHGSGGEGSGERGSESSGGSGGGGGGSGGGSGGGGNEEGGVEDGAAGRTSDGSSRPQESAEGLSAVATHDAKDSVDGGGVETETASPGGEEKDKKEEDAADEARAKLARVEEP